MKMKKIAIIHDTFTHIGGAEKVLIQLISLYPTADIYIGIADKKFKTVLEEKLDKKIATSIFSSLSISERYLSFFKPLLLLYWQTLNLNAYNLVISSSHSFSSKSVHVKKRTPHISYIHTPPRYLYDEFNEMNWLKHIPFSWIFSPVLYVLRALDILAAARPTVLLANSSTTAARIKKYYNRDSQIVYPPVKISPIVQRKPTYYLYFSRLSKQKKVSELISIFTQLQLPLMIVGKGTVDSELQRTAGPTIIFRGFVPGTELVEIIKKTKALIYPSENEDFGMATAEIMSYGVPVIAKSGGRSSEIIKDGINGVLFSQLTLDEIRTALAKAEKIAFDPTVVHASMNKFSVEKFRRKIVAIINETQTK